MDPFSDGGPEPGSDEELFLFAMMDEEQRHHAPAGHGPVSNGTPSGCLILLAAVASLLIRLCS